LFASLRESLGRDQLELDLPEGATAEDAWKRLVEERPALAARRGSLTAAVNRRYLPFDSPLSAGDEVVFIPPVSGG
jgi:molybdopterin synthase sulfur carrier subunit